MMNTLGEYQEWASHVIGERLSEVRGLIYVYENPTLNILSNYVLFFPVLRAQLALGAVKMVQP